MSDSGCGGSSSQEKVKSPEFVQKLTEKVYALWLRDLQIERERRRAFGAKRSWSKPR